MHEQLDLIVFWSVRGTVINQSTGVSSLKLHLLVIDHEVVRKDFVLDIAVLVLRSFRNDVAVLNKQLSPSVVLLDPLIHRRIATC